MFKTIRNFHKFFLKVTPKTALHIGAGDPDISPVASDMTFTRIKTPYGTTMYLPGSSFKGVFRSDSEALLDALNKETCKLMSGKKKDKDCGNNDVFKNKEEIAEEVYPKVCPACKTFGNMKMASVVRFEDFFPYKSEETDEIKANKVNEIEKYIAIRNGIKIDRLTGSTVKNALFDFEVLSGGEFFGNLILKNPEIWQVLLINKTIDSINSGYIKIGGKKSRGLGQIKLEIEKLEIYSTSNDGINFTKYDNNNFKNNHLLFDAKNKERDLIGTKFILDNEEEIKNYFDTLIKNLPKEWWFLWIKL